MSEPLELKKTLNLPRTDFPMKASLPQERAEPAGRMGGAQTCITAFRNRAQEGADYVLHDGPPYPTGTIHLGTGLNKILKDMVVKSKTMAGFRAPYVPGWDCHGLPIETQVEKELGGKKGSVPRRRIPAHVPRICDSVRGSAPAGFQAAGRVWTVGRPVPDDEPAVRGDDCGAFITISWKRDTCIAGCKPVYWCIVDCTALAEAEVEYEDHTSPSIWVKFKVVGGGSGAAAKIWAGCLRRDLDHYSVDDSAQPSAGVSSRLRIRGGADENGEAIAAGGRPCSGVAGGKRNSKRQRCSGRTRDGNLRALKFQHPFLPI